MFNRL